VELRPQAEADVEQKIRGRMEDIEPGQSFYLSPIISTKIGGKEFLIKSGDIARRMGLEAGDKLNYWKVPAGEVAPPVAAPATPAPSPERPQRPLPGREPIAQRLRAVAERMQGEIDNKRRPMTQNPTPKRMREYRSRLLEADNLERGQRAIQALADAHAVGTVPKELTTLRTKAAILPLVSKHNVGTGYYDVVPSQDYSNTTPQGRAMQALIETSRTPEQQARDAEKARTDKIRELEDRVQFSNIPGYFPTPASTAKALVDAAEIEPGMKVLEPSAGKGNIADAIRRAVPDADLSVIEWNRSLQDILKTKGYTVAGSDFLEEKGKYDRIVMNPPFENGQDIDHIRHAYELLNPGGRVVSVMGEGGFFRNDKKAQAFREWFDTVGGTSEKLAEGAFKSAERPTGVSGRMVTITKPAGRVAAEEARTTAEPVGARAMARPIGPIPTSQLPIQGKPVGTGDVVNVISKAFNVPIRVGHFLTFGRRLGIYKQLEGVARIKGYGDIAVASHEAAHHVDRSSTVLSGVSGPALTEVKNLDYSQNRRDKHEGFAEFVRYYLTTDEAPQKAPAFHDYFVNQWLPNNPEWATKFSEAKAGVDQWRQEGALARVKAQIDLGTSHWQRVGIRLRHPIQAAKDVGLWFVDNFQNRLNPLWRAASEMTGVPVRRVLERMDPNVNFAAFAKVANMAASAKARAAAEFGMTDVAGNKVGPGLAEIFNPIAKELRDAGTLSDWYAYAYSRHALDVIAKEKNPGITAEDAQFVVNQFDSRPGWREASDGLTKWHGQLLDYVVEAGGVSPEVAQLAKDMYPHFISLARSMETGPQGVGTGGARLAGLPSPMRRLKGSGRPILPPLETALMYAERLIGLGDKIRVGRMFVEAAERYGKLGDLVEKVDPKLRPTTTTVDRIKSQLEQLGADLSDTDLEGVVTIFSQTYLGDAKDNILTFYRDGKRELYWIRPDLFKTFMALDKPFTANNVLFKAAHAVAKGIRLGATGLRASFGLVTNPLRDVQTALMQTEAQARNPLSVVVGALRGIVNDIADTEVAQLWKRGGGEMAQPLGIDRRFLKEAVDEILSQDPKSKVLSWAKHPVDSLRGLVSVPEAGPRLAEFEAALKKLGWSPGQEVTFEQYVKAQLAAANVTVDFREGGALGMWINQLVPFFNPQIQGPARMADAFRRRPATTMLTGLMWLTLPGLLLWYKYKDDDWYTKLPAPERYRYYHFKLPGMQTPIRIPRAFEWSHLFSSIPEGIVDSLYRKNPQAVGEAVGRALRDLAPPVIPGVAAPGLEVYANWSEWRDRPLVPKGLERLKPEERYTLGTSEVAKAIGRLLGVSPIAVDHLVEGYTGGLGRDILQGVERAGRETGIVAPKGMAPPELADLPIVGRVFLRPNVTRVFDDFYREKERVDQEVATAKARRTPPAPGSAAQASLMDKAADQLAHARAAIRTVIEDQKKTDEEKRRFMLRVQTSMEQIARGAMPTRTPQTTPRRLPGRPAAAPSVR